MYNQYSNLHLPVQIKGVRNRDVRLKARHRSQAYEKTQAVRVNKPNYAARIIFTPRNQDWKG